MTITLTAAQPAPKHEALARKLLANADDYRRRRQYPSDEHAAKLFSEAADALTAAQPAMTDAEIEAIADSVRVDPVDSQRTTWHKRFARAVERRVRDGAAQPAQPILTDAELLSLLPGVRYMDPPDGGDVSPLEQFKRMAVDAARFRWLRDNPTFMGWEHDFRADEVDSQVDAAMRGEKS